MAAPSAPPEPPQAPAGWCRIPWRRLIVGLLVLALLALTVALYLVERGTSVRVFYNFLP
jgi:hypothetical protein